MASEASGSNEGEQQSQGLPILTKVENTIAPSSNVDLQSRFATDPTQTDQTCSQPALKEDTTESALATQANQQDNDSSYSLSHKSPSPYASPMRVRSSQSSSRHVPEENSGRTPFSSPIGSIQSSNRPLYSPPQQARYLTQSAIDSPFPSFSSLCPSRLGRVSPSNLQESPRKAAAFHHDASQFHHVAFHSPVATGSSASSESLSESTQIHYNITQSALVDRMSSPSSHTAVPDKKPMKTLNVVHKLILRAKTPSFSSDDGDGQPEFCHSKHVSLNSDKGWEPDVKPEPNEKKQISRGDSSINAFSTSSRGKDKSSLSSPASTSSTSFKRGFGPTPPTALQCSPLRVPGFGIRGPPLSSASGSSGVTGNTSRVGVSRRAGTTDFLDQEELMQQTLGPEQQVRNAENHVKAMQEALQKAFNDRKEAENRTAVAEARLKSSLALRPSEGGESVLMEKFWKAEEELNVSQALLEKSRESAVASEARALQAELLDQKEADHTTSSVKTLLEAGQQETNKYRNLYIEATRRLERAEKRVEIAEGLQGQDRQATKYLDLCKEAIERAERAEQRAEKAESLQEEDRKWTVDAEERAVFAEEKANAATVELFNAKKQIGELQVKLTKAEYRGDQYKKSCREAEAEIHSCIEECVDVVKRIQDKFNSLHGKYTKLKEYHKCREEEYMACNEEWNAHEQEYADYLLELRVHCDKAIARKDEALAKVQPLEEKIDELIHDKNLIASTLARTLDRMRDGMTIDESEIRDLIGQTAKSSSMKGDKEVSESATISHENARHMLEGRASTLSLNTVEKIVFGGPRMEGLGLEDKALPKLPPASNFEVLEGAAGLAAPVSVSAPASASGLVSESAPASISAPVSAFTPISPSPLAMASVTTTPKISEDGALREQLEAILEEQGVLRLPDYTRGAWYNVIRSSK